MKRASCFASLLVLLVSVAASAKETNKKVTFSKLYPMPAKVLQNIKPGKDIPDYITKTEKGLKIDDKHKMTFAIHGNAAMVVPTELATEEHEPIYQTYFRKVGEITRPDGTMICSYCSCGDNYMRAQGDVCEVVGSGLDVRCAGGCYGQSQGKTCSFTTVSYGPIGSHGVTVTHLDF